MTRSSVEPEKKGDFREPRERLRIGLVSPLWGKVPPDTYGGIERRVDYLARDLVDRGHTVTLFATGDSTTPARLVPAYPCGLVEAMDRQEAFAYEFYLNASIAEALRRAPELDILHFHLGSVAIPFSISINRPSLHTIPTALTVDDLWVIQRYPEVPLTALSHRQIHQLPSNLRRRIHVVYNGCDFDRYRLAGGPKEHLVFMGRMGSHKSPVDAIQIARKLGLPIHLAGAPVNGPERVYFEEEVKPLVDDRSVLYHGEVTDQEKSELFDRAIALMFPIRWEEPFGNVMIEAMACGIPVVACALGSVPEVIEPGKNGYYASSADGLIPLVSKAAALDREEVREYARGRFSHRRMVDDYLSVYSSLLGPGS